MAEQPHSTGMFLIYMRDYFDEATHRLSRGPDMLETLGTLRKIVALGLACLEQNDSYDGKPVTLDDLFETIRRSGRMVPLHSRFHVFHVDLSTYLLKIRQCLVDGEVRLAAMNGESGLVIIREIVQIGVECFEKYGIPPRATRSSSLTCGTVGRHEQDQSLSHQEPPHRQILPAQVQPVSRR